MVLDPRASGCAKVYADLLRKTTRLLTIGMFFADKNEEYKLEV